MDKSAIIKALRDTAQSASNAIAGNVSGPVDLIAAALRAGGLPVNNPIGGSQWMAERGLTREVESGAPRVIGETLGMAGPALATAYAPQIASAINQGQRNLMAPSTMNKQRGAIVWHGSPHKFDRFDSSKIGTGEGAQAYGHGLYLAESPDVAKEYSKMGDQFFRYKGKPLAEGSIDDMAAQYIWSQQGDKAAAIDDAMGNPKLQAAIRRLDPKLIEQGGSVYKVDLPDDQIAKMLDWDKPISEQPQAVKDALAKLPKGWATGSGGQRQFIDPLMSRKTGGGFLEELQMLRRGQPEELLKQQGIPGIRYLDQGSRGAGQGTSNFVVFPGNENMLRIIERNGQPLGLMGVR